MATWEKNKLGGLGFRITYRTYSLTKLTTCWQSGFRFYEAETTKTVGEVRFGSLEGVYMLVCDFSVRI